VATKEPTVDATLKDHINRYFVARHGKDYFYRAPETYDNALERWMLAVGAGDMGRAEHWIGEIENYWKGVNAT
jgi:hypothetical protein